MDQGKTYTGTKTLKTWPMARGEYNAYRGWAAPEGEDQSTAGYLVEYTDGGAANDSRHAGYISWSPADVFNRAYKVADTFQDRVRNERADLADNVIKLSAFLQTHQFAQLTDTQREDLLEQHTAMMRYVNILDKRIAAF